ncbi:MAG: MBL fold metallo-hydrolase [bacterium]
MKVTILGSRGAYPNKDEGCSGYLFQADGYNLLIDCGSGVVSMLQNYIKLTELDSVIISHYHADHFSDISVLQHGIMIECMANNMEKNLDIYGNQENENYGELTYKNYTTGMAYQEGNQLNLGPFRVNFLKTQHSSPCCAVQILYRDKKIVYTADTAYFDQLVSFSENADLLLAECSLYPGTDGQQMGHMNSTDNANLANNAGVNKLIISHLPNYGDNRLLLEDAKKHFSSAIELAKSGMEIKLILQ